MPCLLAGDFLVFWLIVESKEYFRAKLAQETIATMSVKHES